MGTNVQFYNGWDWDNHPVGKVIRLVDADEVEKLIDAIEQEVKTLKQESDSTTADKIKTASEVK